MNGAGFATFDADDQIATIEGTSYPFILKRKSYFPMPLKVVSVMK